MRAALIAALLVWVGAAWFMNTRPGWNVNTQLALTLAIVEHGTLSIDAYHEHPVYATGDKALFEGHTYSDKSPLTSFLGVVPVWAVVQAYRLAGGEPDPAVLRWVVTVMVVGLAAAVLTFALALMLMRRGVAPGTAAVGAALWWAATPLAGYSILFFNYLPACALALGGWAIAERAWRVPDAVRPRELLLAGMLLGLATWALNTLALAALALTLPVAFAAWRARRGAWFGAWAVGGVLGAAGHFIYQYAVFGSFGSAYQYEADPFFREMMGRGLMGATAIQPLVLWLITLHPYRGLFFWWPLTLLALCGLLWGCRRTGGDALRGGGRTDAALAGSILAALLIYTSAYFMWWGGMSYAPRHLIPALPGLALGLAPLLRTRGGGIATIAVGVLGAAINLSVVALDPQMPAMIPQEYLMEPWRIARWPAPMLQGLRYVWLGWQVDRNLGVLAGLSGTTSLLPLALVWVAALWLLLRPRRAADTGP